MFELFIDVSITTMADSESESDFEFEGFTDENVREAAEKLQEKEQELDDLINNDESDIDVDEDSDSEQESDQDGGDDVEHIDDVEEDSSK